MEKYSMEETTLTVIDSELDLMIQEECVSIKIPNEMEDNKIVSKDYRLRVISNEGNIEEAYLEKQGMRHGQSLLYYSSGKKKMEHYYDNGILHGPVTFYSEEGNILSIVWYVRGKKQGKSKRFYFSSKPYCVLRFYNDQPHGKQEYFYENGKVKTLISYKHGVLEGKTELFNPKGEIEREYLFSKGKNQIA